ncbi:MAG: GAF domain-containing protein, partial [Actinomycetota bacterium]
MGSSIDADSLLSHGDRGGGRFGRAWRQAVGAVKEAFAPSGIAGEPHLNVTRAVYRVRALISIMGLGFWWLYPAGSPTEVRTYLLLVGGIFLPYSVVLLLLSKRSDHPALHIAGLVADLTILFLFQTLLPATHLVVMFGYLLVLTFHASLGGMVAGLVLTPVIMGLVLFTEQVVYGGRGLDGYTLIKYALVLLAVSNLLHTVTKEQRRANKRLAALLHSLRFVSSSLEVREVLDALVDSVRRSLRAEVAAVVLIDEPAVDPDGGDALVAATARSAMQLRRPVVVDDVGDDGGRRPGAPRIRSLISVPLVDGSRAIGVLNAGFRQPRRISEGVRDLVAAYAEQATSAVLRARSYERAKRAEAEVKRLNAVLERRVEERTFQLERIQAELHAQLEVTQRQARALAEISKRIAGARDEERQRLARDLHDGIQQQLVVLRMNLGLRPKDGPGPDDALLEVEQELDRIISRMREVAQDIYPTILVDRGLTAAVHSYAGRLPFSTRIATDPNPLPRLDPRIEGTAYFVLCEAVTNALKHSQGSQLDISLRLTDGVLELGIRDDGRGFDALPSPGRGLVHMRDRVRSFGGELVVRPAQPHGVEVLAAIPTGAGEAP